MGTSDELRSLEVPRQIQKKIRKHDQKTSRFFRGAEKSDFDQYTMLCSIFTTQWRKNTKLF